MFPPQDIVDLVAEIARHLRASESTLAVSENVCGGLIASYLVSMARASEYFVGGTTTYSLRSRLHLSGWSQQDIQSYTGPSESVALRLARNLRTELGATFTLAETGWAGPTAPSEADVGSVFLAFAGPASQASVSHKSGLRVRTENMEAFAKLALEFLLANLTQLAVAQGNGAKSS